MAAGLPAGQKLEIEFTPGGWIDVSADVDFGAGVTIQRGRKSVFDTPSFGTMTFELNNTTGAYTPMRQVLADGVTAHPYYPNVVPRKRVRYSNTPSGVRFLGYIQSWPPLLENGVRGHSQITAYDRLKLLDKVTLKSPIQQEQLTDSPVRLWPFTDGVNATTVAEAQGNTALTEVGSGAGPTFGATGPNEQDKSAVKFNPFSSTSGLYFSTNNIGNWIKFGSTDWTIEAYIQRTAAPTFIEGVWSAEQAPPAISFFGLQINTSGQVVFAASSGSITGPVVTDGNFHHVAVTSVHASNTSTLYVDGVSAGTLNQVYSPLSYYDLLVGQTAINQGATSGLFGGTIAQLAAYTSALSTGRITAHADAIDGYAGDFTGVRLQRILAAAGLGPSDWTLDSGATTVTQYPQIGVSALQACQDIATTEGGGAAFYVDATGSTRFVGRHYRTPAAPVMTVDAVQDLLPSPFAPSVDDMTLINQSTVTRDDALNTLSTQVYSNQASITANGVTTDTVTSYTATDADALGLAQWRIAVNQTFGYRIDQIAVDLMTAQNNLYAALANVQIGSRIRIMNLPAAAAPAGQLDFYVEGWTETPSTGGYVVQFDLSPADNPAFGVFGPSTYGVYQADPGTTLNATITAAATTLAIATTGTTFTTTAGSYPFNVQIGQEVITLNSAPGGSTSPQTFTGVTRGANGTPAAAQASGATVSVWPLATYGF